MKKLYLVLTATIIFQAAAAQFIFTLEHAGSTKVFSKLDSALYYASDGDFLYLPGAPIAGNMIINKKLQIFGAGHYPDSTQATGQSIITGHIFFVTGSAGSMLQGVYITGNIFFGTDPGNANTRNIHISRCNVTSIYLSTNGENNMGVENIIIRENVLRDAIWFAGSQNILVENNLIEGGLVYGNGMIKLRQNIFLRRSPYLINQFSGAVFENNIIMASGSFVAAGGNNFYYNNIFRESDPLGSEFSSGNQFNVTDLFINQSGNSFSYQQNYHLTNTSPARAAGTLGTDCGIYGGANPYKEGAVPANPHIQYKLIPAQTDAQGKLIIQIRVAAQQL